MKRSPLCEVNELYCSSMRVIEMLMILVSSVEIRFLLIVVQSTVKNDSRYFKLFSLVPRQNWFIWR